MAEAGADLNTGQWALSAAAGLQALLLGWLWQRQGSTETRLDGRITEAERSARGGAEAARAAGDAGIDKLWNAVTEDRKAASEHRERMIERMGAVATREDLANMEARIMKQLEHQRTPG